MTTRRGQGSTMRARTTTRGVLTVFCDMRARRWALVAILTALGACAPRAHAAAPGGLTQLPGAAGCVSSGGAGGCAAVHDLADVAEVAISPDGKNVYAT